LLEDEKGLLDALLEKIAELEQANPQAVANLFKTLHSDAVALTVGTVAVSNKAIVEAALTAFEALSGPVKTLLETEKALLDGLLVKIRELQVAAFTETHAAALALTVETVEIANKPIVQAALNAFNGSSGDIKTLLGAQKALLDNLLAEIVVLETAAANQNTANNFRTTYSSVLGLTLQTVSIINKGNVDNAIYQYGLLNDAVKELLAAEKTHLDALLAKINELQAEIDDLAASEKFKADYADVLELTVEGVEVGDKGGVQAALMEFEALSPGAKLLLKDEGELIAGLLAKIAFIENSIVADSFKSSHSAALALEISSVATSDRTIVNSALTALSGLSPDVRALLGIEQTKLEALVARISVLDQVELFTGMHGAALALSVGAVEIADKEIVEAALDMFEILSADVKALLTAQKTLLDNLLTKIGELETAASIQAAANGFKSAHATALALTDETVAIANKGIVETAITAFNGLAGNVKALLGTEKTLLDNLLVKIGELEVAAANQATADIFKNLHSAALALTVETVAIANKTAVETALTALSGLDAAVKALLGTEKTKLDNLLVKIGELEIAANIQAAVNSFKSAHAAALALTVNNVTVGNKAIVQAALTAFNDLSAEVQALLETEEALLDSLTSKIGELENQTPSEKCGNGLLSANGGLTIIFVLLALTAIVFSRKKQVG